MIDSKVTILTKGDVEKRYSGDLRYSHSADEAFRVIKKGEDLYVALVEDPDFFGGIGNEISLKFHCNSALKKAFPDYKVAKFVNFIDKSELSKNRLFISCLLVKCEQRKAKRGRR